MSPNVGNFVHDLVEMAKAMETLPQVQDELARANTALDNYAQMVQARELAIVNYKDQIEQLNAKVRSLEVERDDASFRVLEAEEQTYRANVLARAMQTTLGSMIAELDPPKPEPVKEPEPVASAPSKPQAPTTSAEGQSEASPTTTSVGAGYTEQSLAPISETVHSISEVSPGQSESSPTVSTVEASMSSAPPASDGGNQGSTDPESTHGPYFGKRYRDIAGYVSYHDWLDGGGTDEDYDWRLA